MSKYSTAFPTKFYPIGDYAGYGGYHQWEPITASYWDQIDDPYDSPSSASSIYYDTTSSSSKSATVKLDFSRLPLSCGMKAGKIYLYIREDGPDEAKCTFRLYNDEGIYGGVTREGLWGASFGWQSFSVNRDWPIVSMQSTPYKSLVRTHHLYLSLNRPNFGDQDAYVYVADAYYLATIFVDTCAPSMATLYQLNGYDAPVSPEVLSDTPDFSAYYKDASNASFANYDETSQVRWAVGLYRSGSSITGTVFDVTVATVAPFNSYVSIPFPNMVNTTEIDLSQNLYGRVAIWDANENMSTFSRAATLIDASSVLFFNNSWTRRAEIIFPTPHATLPRGYTATLAFSSGVFKVIATNGHIDESVNHSAGDQIQHVITEDYDRTYFAWRSQDDLAAYISYYNNTAGSMYIGGRTKVFQISYDTHEYPNLLVDASGWVHVIIGKHGDPAYYFKSDATCNIDSFHYWFMLQDFDNGTYPRFRYDKNTKKMSSFYRGRSSWQYAYQRCSPMASNWGTLKYIINYKDTESIFKKTDGFYASIYGGGVYIDNNSRIHIGFTWHEKYGDDNYGRAISYIYSDNGTEWFNLDGSIAGTTVIKDDYNTASYQLVSYDKCTKLCVAPSIESTPPRGPYYLTNSESLKVLPSGTVFFYIAKLPWCATTETGTSYQYHQHKPVTPLIAISQPGNTWATIDLYDQCGYKCWMHRQGGPIQYYWSDFYNKYVVHAFGAVKTEDEDYFGGEVVQWTTVDVGQNWGIKFLTKNSANGIPMFSCLSSTVHQRPELLMCRLKDVLYYDGSSQGTVFLSSGDDIRVTYGTKELDRLPENYFNSKQTVISFPLQHTINKWDSPTGPKYYLYYGNYFAKATGKRAAGSVFRHWEGFEAYDTEGTILFDKGWTNSTHDNFVIRSYGSFGNTNKLYSGDRAFYMPVYGSISRGYPTSSESTEFQIAYWEEANVGGSAGFQLRFTCANGSYYYTGIHSSKAFSEYSSKNPSWTQFAPSTTSDSKIEHFVRVILSTMVKVYVDNNLVGHTAAWRPVLSDTNKIEKVVVLNGEGDSDCDRIFIDHILVKDWVHSTPEVVPTSWYIKDYTGTTSVINTAILSYCRLARSAHVVFSEKDAIHEIANRVLLEGNSFINLANGMEAEKTGISDLAHILYSDKQFVEKVHHAVISDKLLYEVVSNIADVDKKVVFEVANIALLNKNLISKIANSIMLLKPDESRINHFSLVDKYTTVSIANLLSADKELVDKLAMYASSDKSFALSVSNKLTGDKTSREYLSNLLLSNKEFKLVVANAIYGDKDLSTRISNCVLAEKDSTLRIKSLVDIDKEVSIRVKNDILLNKEVLESISNSIVADKFVSYTIFNTAVSDKQFVDRVYNIAVADHNSLYRVAMSSLGDKDAAYRVANTILLEDVLYHRVINSVIVDKKLSIKFANSLSSNKAVKESVSNIVNFLQTIRSNRAETADFEAEKDARISELATFVISRISKFAETFYADKSKMGRIPENVELERLLVDNVFSELADFSAMKVALMSESSDFLRTFYTSMAETLYTSKDNVDNVYSSMLLLIKNDMLLFSEQVNMLATKLTKMAGMVDFLSSTTDSSLFAENIYLNKLYIKRLSELTSLVANRYKSFSGFISMISNNFEAISESVNFVRSTDKRMSGYISFTAFETLIKKFVGTADFNCNRFDSVSEFVEFIKREMPELIMATGFSAVRSHVSISDLGRSEIAGLEVL